MAASLVFPTRLLGPAALQVRVAGASIGGPSNLVGEQSLTDIGGGGRVMADFSDIAMFDRDKVLAFRRFVAGSKNGAAPVLLGFADRRHQPVIPRYTGADTFGLATYVADDTLFTPAEVFAAVSSDAALGSTELSFTFDAPVALQGGEWFCIRHPTYGWRAYWIWLVVEGGTGDGGMTTVQFSPPLREASPGGSPGTVLNFESVRCVMQAPGDQSETLTQLKFGKAAARFVEWPGPLPG